MSLSLSRALSLACSLSLALSRALSLTPPSSLIMEIDTGPIVLARSQVPSMLSRRRMSPELSRPKYQLPRVSCAQDTPRQRCQHLISIQSAYVSILSAFVSIQSADSMLFRRRMSPGLSRPKYQLPRVSCAREYQPLSAFDAIEPALNQSERVCVCVYEREGEKERERKKERVSFSQRVDSRVSCSWSSIGQLFWFMIRHRFTLTCSSNSTAGSVAHYISRKSVTTLAPTPQQPMEEPDQFVDARASKPKPKPKQWGGTLINASCLTMVTVVLRGLVRLQTTLEKE